MFHRLREHHFPAILDRQLDILNEQLASRRIRVEIEPEARAYLIARGSNYPRHGAWFLIKSFRRYVVFPVADMVADGSTSNARVQVDLEAAAVRSTELLRRVLEPSERRHSIHRGLPGFP